MKSEKETSKPEPASKVVNLNMYKIKKSLLDEGFEIVEKPDGKISLVIRVSR